MYECRRNYCCGNAGSGSVVVWFGEVVAVFEHWCVAVPAGCFAVCCDVEVVGDGVAFGALLCFVVVCVCDGHQKVTNPPLCLIVSAGTSRAGRAETLMVAETAAPWFSQTATVTEVSEKDQLGAGTVSDLQSGQKIRLAIVSSWDSGALVVVVVVCIPPIYTLSLVLSIPYVQKTEISEILHTRGRQTVRDGVRSQYADREAHHDHHQLCPTNPQLHRNEPTHRRMPPPRTPLDRMPLLRNQPD